MQNFENFQQSAAKADLIPLYSKMIADVETPVSVLARFADDENVFLLESVEAGERSGRYSFIGVKPRGVFTIEEGLAFYTHDGIREALETPKEGAVFALRKLLRTKELKALSLPDLPPLLGGAIGFMGYETVNQFEALPPPKPGAPKLESAFLITDEMIVFDNLRHIMILSVTVRPGEYPSLKAAYDDGCSRLSALCSILRAPLKKLDDAPLPAPVLHSNLGRDAYLKMVEEAKRHIYDGDIIQVVLSHKFMVHSDLSALRIYRALRLVNPSPYMFFLKIGEKNLVGSSPETLVRLQNNCATVRPIAGTRPRGGDAAADRAMADELLRDEKERAEHLMLLDLGRNDLGRIATPGSVQVKDFMTVERYSHVMHLVSTVEALPRPEVDAFELLRATFPAGTLSGAPKVRAMELIHELEPEARGVYGGACGYFSYDGNMDLAITIRTLEMERGDIVIQSGAGIVFDSDPEKEYQETVNKAGALFQALKLAAASFKL